MDMTAGLPAATEQRSLPGDFAIWIFIYAELLVFGVFFLAYAFARSHNVELFDTQQRFLDRTTGAINTLVLITSSFLVVRAVNAIRRDAAAVCARWLAAAASRRMGMVILSVVAVKARRGAYSVASHTGVETGASYWHMVDLVWIVLFPLVYVMH